MENEMQDAEYDAKVMYEDDGTMHIVIKQTTMEEDEQVKYMEVTVFDLAISQDDGATMNVYTMQREEEKENQDYWRTTI